MPNSRSPTLKVPRLEKLSFIRPKIPNSEEVSAVGAPKQPAQLESSLEIASTVSGMGSGGGLPGVPLAIVLPGLTFVLVEATGKKARFLEQTATALDLANVQVVNERAETLGQDRENHREHVRLRPRRAECGDRVGR